LYYLQAQAYWVLANWMLFAATGANHHRDLAIRCSEEMIARQRPDGAWPYPNPEWRNRVATAEGTWASLALIETFRQTGSPRFLAGALLWYKFFTTVIGFEQIDSQLSANYFASQATSRVPNNSAFVLRFLAELSDATQNATYLEKCEGLLRFMKAAQKESGEFPYMVRGRHTGVKLWEHFQCYQYNAFQCLDLMRCYQLTSAIPLPAIIAKCLRFLDGGISEDGQVLYSCDNRHTRIAYHTAATGAALSMAAAAGFGSYEQNAQRVFSYLRRVQRTDGSFGFSTGDYYVLNDVQAYPRPLAMILYHLLVRSMSRLTPSSGVGA